MSFWKELKRRNVYKVGVAYAIVAWLIIQAVAIIFPAQHLPGWTVTFVTALLIIGFPFVLIFAWAFEITPDGLKWTKDVPHHESITHLTGKKLNYILAGLLVIAVGYILVDKLYIEQRTSNIEQMSVTSDVTKVKETIAVIPFVNLSPDPDQEYFVDGLTEEILNSLAQLPDLTVIARTSSFSFKGKDKTIQEIAAVLGVDNILEGSVRKAGNALRITAQLVKAVDGSHLWSKTYDRELKDIFVVQEDIATTVANELKITLGVGKSLKQLGGTENVEAYQLYLIAKGLWLQGGPSDMNPLELIDSAIALDPEFALAWATNANLYAINFQLDAGLQAAQRAIEIEPNLAYAYAALGGNRMRRREWIEAELAFRKALELSTEPISGNPYFSQLIDVGHLRKARENIEAQMRIDPLDRLIWGFYISSCYLLGDTQQAEKEIKRAEAFLGDQ